MSKLYLQGLNEQQKEAVDAIEGPVMVLAGAGSGKTKTLISRIAHLIAEGVEPGSILAVTFTNKAAAEMKHRVGAALAGAEFQGRAWAQPWMGFSSTMPEVSTFHSFCVKLLRQESAALGFTKPFMIYDDDDQLSLTKKILEEFNIDPKVSSPKRFKSVIDSCKCLAQGPEDIDPKQFLGPFGQQIVNVYTRYQETLRSSHAFDFGDLIVESYKLLKNHPEILEKYQERFRYLMVDEYQDTNRAQYLLVSLLAKKYRNLCVVGDEDQSIYKWRGADIRNILDFKSDYPDARVVKLEQNYRSTQTIIKAASAVIKNNKSRYDKTLWTANEPGDKIHWVTLPDERSEAELVAKEITKFLARNPSYTHKDVAVFYRSHAQSRGFEEAFRKSRVPYRIVGGVGFYERKEIKDAFAYLRVLVNSDDSISLLRIINTPARGLGKSTIEKVEEFSRSRRLSFYQGLKTFLSEGNSSIAPSTAKKLAEFVRLIDSFADLARRSFVSDVYHHILEATGYVAELKAENSDESKARIQNLEELDTVIQFFEEDAKQQGLLPGTGLLQAFLNQITLESSLLKTEEQGDAISMMTLHSSKGLEFPFVAMVGCEEGIFPSRQSLEEGDYDEEKLEEERRLCYVGLTRARKSLLLTNAQIRRIYGQVQVSAASRFLYEIPTELMNIEIQRNESSLAGTFGQKASYGATSWRAHGSFRNQENSKYENSERVYDYSDSEPTYQVKSAAVASGGAVQLGQKVKHQSYGVGTVKGLEGSTSDRKVTIEFSGKVLKKFSLQHVELELL